MKLETLRDLIKQIKVSQEEIDNWDGNIENAVIDKVLNLLTIYENDLDFKPLPSMPIYPTGIRRSDPYCEPDMVPYGEICSCNPKNGGSGICGCIMGNQLVPNTKKGIHSQKTSIQEFGPRNIDC